MNLARSRWTVHRTDPSQLHSRPQQAFAAISEVGNHPGEEAQIHRIEGIKVVSRGWDSVARSGVYGSERDTEVCGWKYRN